MSKPGIGLALIYLVVAAGVYCYSQWCGVGWCGVVAIVPTLPWLLLFRYGFEAFGGFDSAPFAVTAGLSVALNVVSFYGIGWALGRAFAR